MDAKHYSLAGLLKNSRIILRRAQDERGEVWNDRENSVHAEALEAFRIFFRQPVGVSIGDGGNLSSEDKAA